MLGRTPGKVKAIKPMKDGVIADFEITEIMLNSFIKKIKAKKLFSRPRILICCPTNITPVEKNAIKEAEDYAVSDRALVDFDTHLRAYDFVCTIKRFYRDNNIQGYLDFIDENGYIFRRGATR